MDKIVDHLFVFEGEGVINDFRWTYSEYKSAQEEKLKVQELEQQKQKLSTELGFERVNLKYLKEKTEEQRTELSELKEQKQQIQRSTGLKR